MNDYERQLKKSAQNGCVEAYEELIRPHRGRIYTLMLRECGDEFKASLLTQEVFVKAFEALLSRRSDSSLVCDIYRIAEKVSRQNSCISGKNVLAASM